MRVYRCTRIFKVTLLLENRRALDWVKSSTLANRPPTEWGLRISQMTSQQQRHTRSQEVHSTLIVVFFLCAGWPWCALARGRQEIPRKLHQIRQTQGLSLGFIKKKKKKKQQHANDKKQLRPWLLLWLSLYPSTKTYMTTPWFICFCRAEFSNPVVQTQHSHLCMSENVWLVQGLSHLYTMLLLHAATSNTYSVEHETHWYVTWMDNTPVWFECGYTG